MTDPAPAEPGSAAVRRNLVEPALPVWTSERACRRATGDAGTTPDPDPDIETTGPIEIATHRPWSRQRG